MNVRQIVKFRLFHFPFRETKEFRQVNPFRYVSRGNSANAPPISFLLKKEHRRRTDTSILSWIFQNIYEQKVKINSFNIRSFASYTANLIPYMDPNLGVDEKRKILNDQMSHFIFKKQYDYAGYFFLFVSQNHQDRVYFYMRRTLHIEPNEQTVVNLTNIYKRTGESKKLYQLLDEIQEEDIKINKNENVYGALIDAFAKEGDSLIVGKLIEEMISNGIVPNAVIYNSLMNAAAIAGDSSKVKEVFSNMVNSGIKPDDVSYNILIKEAVKAKSVGEVSRLMMEMANNGIKPSQRTFVEAAQVVETSEQLRSLLDTIEDLQIPVGVISFNTFVNAAGRLKDFELAKQILDWMEERKAQADVITYTSLIDNMGKAGLPKEAYTVFELMLEKGIRPNEVTFGALMKTFEANSDLDKVLKIWNAMKKEKIEPNEQVSTILLSAFAKNGKATVIHIFINFNSKECLDLLSQMKKRFRAIPPHSFTVVLDGLTKAKALTSSVIKILASEIDSQNMEMDQQLLRSLVDALSEVGSIDVLTALLEKMNSIDIEKNKYLKMAILRYYSKHKIEEMEDFFNENFSGWEVDARAYLIMVQAWAKKKKWNDVLGIYEVMNQHTSLPNFQPNMQLFNYVLEALSQSRNPDIFYMNSIISTAKNFGLKMDSVSYTHIIRIYCKNQDIEKVKSLLAEMKKESIAVDIIHFSVIFRSLGEKGNFDQITSFLQIMEAEKIEPDEQIFISLMNGCNKFNNFQMMKQVLNLEENYKIKKTSDFYLPVLSLLFREGNTEEIINILRKMKENNVPLSDDFGSIKNRLENMKSEQKEEILNYWNKFFKM